MEIIRIEISFCLIVLFVIFSTAFAGANRGTKNRKSNSAGQDMYKEIDTLLKSWNRIGRQICREERLSEKKNDQIYNCLRDESDMETVSDFNLRIFKFLFRSKT